MKPIRDKVFGIRFNENSNLLPSFKNRSDWVETEG